MAASICCRSGGRAVSGCVVKILLAASHAQDGGAPGRMTNGDDLIPGNGLIKNSGGVAHSAKRIWRIGCGYGC